MKKEKDEFEEYRSGFFFQRFNRLLRLIRRHRVLPIRPGWEQTPDGIVPPPIYSSEAAGKRPFQVTKTSDTTVQVNTGYFSMIGGLWTTPALLPEGFNADIEITENSFLYLKVTLAQARSGFTVIPVVTNSVLEWSANAAPDTNAASTEDYIIDFTAEDVTRVFHPETEYTIEIQIANVELEEGVISEIGQYIDYNILIPGNANRFYEVTVP